MPDEPVRDAELIPAPEVKVPKTVENVAKVLYFTACCKDGYITDWPDTMQYPMKEYWLHLADAVWRFVYDSPVQSLRDSAQRGEEKQFKPDWQPGFDAGFRAGVERAAEICESRESRAKYGSEYEKGRSDAARDDAEEIRSLLPPAQPEPERPHDLKRLLETIRSAWAAFGDNLESQAMDGHGITREYAHAVQKDLKWAEAFVESLKSQPEPSPAKMSRHEMWLGLAGKIEAMNLVSEGGDAGRIADAALAFMEANGWGPR